jgi:hypothetical protein
MTEDDERTIRSLEFRLSRALDDARRAQKALSAARWRLQLPDPAQFSTADDMDRERAESRAEMRGMVSAVISDCRMRWDRSYVPTPLEAAMQKWPAAFAAAKQAQAAPKAERDNVISLVQQIAAAGNKRRGEVS